MGKTKSSFILNDVNNCSKSTVIDIGVDNEGYQRYNESETHLDLNYNNDGKKYNPLRQVSTNSVRKMSCFAEPVSMSWHNINVFGKSSLSCLPSFRKNARNKTFHILKNVSGQVKPGQLLAIMGASGAGKTTLMNVLTQRNLSDVKVKGTVTLNGKLADINSIVSLSSYIQQDDLFHGTLTVKEHLKFVSIVRMEKNHSNQEREAKVKEILDELNLSKCKNTVIGVPGKVKGISGGERKRLAFASEMFTNPSIMFCDEPTSGLDSFLAQSVVEVLRDMADSGRTIVCTIHQPSSEVFAMFDQLLLMASGRVAYMGKLEQSVEYFANLGMRCPINYNPADYYINELAMIPGKGDECGDKVKRICDHFETSSYSKELMLNTNAVTNDNLDAITTTGVLPKRKLYKANWFTQFRALTWRASLNMLREPGNGTARIFNSIIIAALLGLIYMNENLGQKGVQNINGAIFMLTIQITFQNVFCVIHSICEELPIFLREHNNGMYRVDTFFLSKQIAEFPLFIIIPSLFVCVYYYMVGLNRDVDTFFICLGISILLANCVCSFGYFISCVSKDTKMANNIGPPLLLPLCIFGGMFLNNNSVPVYFIWLKYCAWFYYGTELLMVNQWRNVDHIDCDEAAVAVNDTSLLSNFSINSQTAEFCLKNGPMVLEYLSYEPNYFVRDLFLLVVMTIVLRFIAFGGLLIKSRKR